MSRDIPPEVKNPDSTRGLMFARCVLYIYVISRAHNIAYVTR